VRLLLQRRHVARGVAEALPVAAAHDRVLGQREVVRVDVEGPGRVHFVGALGERRLVVAEKEGGERVARQLRPARGEAAQVVDLHRIPRLEARQADALLLGDRFGLEDAPVGLQRAQVEDHRVGRQLRLAELGDALLVEHARDGVDALDAAAVGEELGGAVVEQPHRAGALGDRGLGGGLCQRDGVAVGPGEQLRALVGGELLTELQIARRESQRSPARFGGALGLAQELEQAGEAAQRLRAARRQRGRGAHGGDRGRNLLARDLDVGELLEAARLGGAQRDCELEQLVGAREVAAIAGELGRCGEAVGAGQERLGETLLVFDRAVPARDVGEQLQRVAAPRPGCQRRLGPGPRARRISACIEQPRPRREQPRGEICLLFAQRRLRLVEIQRGIVEALRVALQRRRGELRAQEGRILADRVEQIGQPAGPPDAVRHLEQQLGAQGQRGGAAGGEGHRAVHRRSRHGAIVAHRRAGEEEGRERIGRVLVEHRRRRCPQIRGIAPRRRGGAGFAERAGRLHARSRQLLWRRARLIGRPAVAAHQRRAKSRSLGAAPAHEELVLSRPEPHRPRLRPGALARIGHARDGHRAVDARLQRRRALDPEQVVAALLQAHFAPRVEDVALVGLQLEAHVAVGEVERAIVHGGRRPGRPVQRQDLAQIEQPQRRERPGDAPALDRAHLAPGVDLEPRIARSLRPAHGDPRGGFAEQACRPRRHRRLGRRSRRGDRSVDFGRFALDVEEPRRRQLGDGVGRRRLQRGDPVPHRRERVGAIFGQLSQPGERQGARRRSARRRRRLEPAGGAARIRGDQVAQPSGARLQRRVAPRRRLGFIELLQRVLGSAVRRSVSMRAERAAEEKDHRCNCAPPRSTLHGNRSFADAVCGAGPASTRRCSASSSRPRNPRNAPYSAGRSSPPLSVSSSRATTLPPSRA